MAFPVLSGGTIEYSQTGPRGMLGYPSEAHREYLEKESVPIVFPVIPCGESPVCRRGGFELWETISSMVREGETLGEFELNCVGSSGRSRTGGPQRCRNTLRFRITLEYKSRNAATQ